MTHIQKTWKVVLIDGGVGSECFTFDPRGEGPYIGLFNSVLRVVWICFDTEQFCAIVHDNDRTRSLLLAPKLFPVHRHVECDNDDLGEVLEVLDGVEVESDDIGNLGGTCGVAAWRFNFSHRFKPYVLLLSISQSHITIMTFITIPLPLTTIPLPHTHRFHICSVKSV